MNRFIKNCLTIASGLCAIGLVLVVLGGIFGGFRQVGSIALGGGFSYPASTEVLSNIAASHTGMQTASAGFLSGESIPDGLYENENVCNREDVSNLSIEIGAYELEVYSWEADTYKVVGENVQGLRCFVSNDTLYLKGSREFWNSAGRHSVTLYVPNDTEFERVEIELGAGEGTIENLTADEMDIQVGAGNLTCNNLTAGTMDIEDGAGKMKYRNCRVGDLNVEIGVGKLDFEGTLEEDADISCAMGNADLILNGKYEDFDYNIEVAAGNLEIKKEDGSRISFNGVDEERIDLDAKKEMDIECAMGNMKIQFQ